MSGTPPQDVLCSQWAAQVAGDADAPIYQPADQFGRTLPGPDLPGRDGPVPRQVESYHWGEMTSGGWSKAIWALLAPFALVNVAHWMLPAGGRKGPLYWLVGFIEAALRLAGWLLTVLFMAQAAVLIMDVVVNQCPRKAHGCLASAHLGWLWEHQRLLSIAGAIVLVLVLWMINRVSVIKWGSNDLAQQSPAETDPQKGALAEGEAFYAGDADAPLLRATHLTAGFSVVAVLLLGGRHVPSSDWQRAVWVIALALLVLSGVFAVALHHPRTAMPSRHPRKLAARAFPLAALACLAVTAIFGPTASKPAAKHGVTPPPALLPGSDDVLSLVMIGLDFVIAAVVAALLVTLFFRKRETGTPAVFRPFTWGLFAAPILILGGLLGSGLGAGYTYIAAGCLDGKCSAVFSSHYGATFTLRLPPAYESLSELWFITGLVIVGCALVLLAGFLLAAGRSMSDTFTPDHLRPAMVIQQPPGARLTAGQRFKVACSWQLTRWRVVVAIVLTTMSALLVVAAVLCLEADWASTKAPILRWLDGVLNLSVLARPTSALGLEAHRPYLAAVGAYVVTAVTLAFLVRVYNAARRPDAARALGILWDLASYWPRAAHPFVPPCYAQKAVPDLVHRTQKYMQDGYQVVLSAHSQGTLIVLATALRMLHMVKDDDDPGSLDRLGLVMAGSQLQWAYPRAFPAVVNVGAYRTVLRELDGRWVVLARGTDPLGGPVLSCELSAGDEGKLTADTLVGGGWHQHILTTGDDAGRPVRWVADHDWWISDPMLPDEDQTGFRLPPFSLATQRHSGYWSHPQWDQAVARAAGQLPQLGRPRRTTG